MSRSRTTARSGELSPRRPTRAKRRDSGVQRTARLRARTSSLDSYLADIAGEPPSHREVVALSQRIDTAMMKAFRHILDMGVVLPELVELVEQAEGDELTALVSDDRALGPQVEALHRAVEIERHLQAAYEGVSRGEPLQEELEALIEERARALGPVELRRAALDTVIGRLASPRGRKARNERLSAPLGSSSASSAWPTVRARKRYRRARAGLRRALREMDAPKRQLIQGNLRLVVSAAKRYAGRGLPLADLIQEGNLGLIRAIEKYDHRCGTKLSTYAMWWIKQALRKALSDHSRTIRIPRHVTLHMTSIERARHRLMQASGREPRLEELAREVGISVDELLRYERAPRTTLSLDAPLHPSSTATAMDVVDDRAAMRRSLDDLEAHQLAEHLLDRLGDRERRVLILRHGLRGHPPHTLREIGEILGLTRERIRQIETSALSRLRRIAARTIR